MMHRYYFGVDTLRLHMVSVEIQEKCFSVVALIESGRVEVDRLFARGAANNQVVSSGAINNFTLQKHSSKLHITSRFTYIPVV